MTRHDRIPQLALVLLLFTAFPLLAVKKQSVQATGNNVGLALDVTNQPMNGVTNAGYKSSMLMHSFPRGSGNYFGFLIHSFAPCITRDADGDGTVEDTVRINMRGQGTWGANCSIESYDFLKSIHDQGLWLSQYARNLEGNRIYSSRDPEDLQDWPQEFRENRSPSGAPVVYGAETIVARYGDTWRPSGIDMPMGFSEEYSWYFLNYGASNNMVFSHVLIRNVSEYLKWSDVEAYREHTAGTPDGQVWHDVGLTLHKHSSFFLVSGNFNNDRMNSVHLYHPAGQMSGIIELDGQCQTWVPSTTPALIEKMIRPPQFNGETMNIRMSCWVKGTDFGVPLQNDFLENGKPDPVMFRALLGDESLYPGVINIWTGRNTAGGWPGVILPEDEFYNKWIWGGVMGMQYVGWGMLHDMAPRDTTSFDWVFMVVPMDEPYEVPLLEVQNINDQGIQDHLMPVLDYAEIAEKVYEGGFIVPIPPAVPALTIIPGDKKVTITWNDISLKGKDPYYTFLQTDPETLDPNGVYREVDFEGFRLYRSFVGPNDSHAEVLLDCSLSDNNLQFYYEDKLSDDINFSRMRNGMKIWYALVPYDRNYDPETLEEFSLPDESSGKEWNRSSVIQGLYSVMPRTDASNFKPFSLSEVKFIKGSTGAMSALESLDIKGDGTGRLTESVSALEPVLEIELDAVIAEKITSELTLQLECYDMQAERGACGNRLVTSRFIRLLDSGGKVLDDRVPPVKVLSDNEVSRVLSAIEDDGATYGLIANFKQLSAGDLHMDIDVGGYTGGKVFVPSYRCGEKLAGASEPSNPGYIRSGNYEVKWIELANGEFSVEVMDINRGVSLPFSPWMGTPDRGWGLAYPIFDTGTSVDRRLHDEDRDHVPFEERQYKMFESIPADYSEARFALYVNGIFWEIMPAEGADKITLPAPGTVFKIANAFGEWNADMTVFTQYPESPWPGDKWEIKINPTTMNAEDANLSKIRVVPNPYIGSSYLDLSPSSRRIEFINLPDRCTIRIYTLSGNLVNVLNHVGSNRLGWGNYTDYDNLEDNKPMQHKGWDNHSGTEPWNLRNRFGVTVASGLYLYHVTDSQGAEHAGKFYIIN